MRKEDEIKVEYLKCEFGSLTLGPDDVVVLKCPALLTQKAVDHLSKVTKQSFGSDRKILILEEGTDIGVLRQQKKPRTTNPICGGE